VHPVVNPGEKNVQISFPKTNDWFDFVTDAKISAGAQLTVAVHEDHIPVYVRAGAFIPLIQKDEQLQSTQFYSDKKMELHYYHDASVSRSAGKMYEDDGLTSQAYEKGIYRLLSFTSEFHTNAVSASLILRMQEQTGRQAKLASRTIDVVIHQVDAQPKTVNMNGKPVAFVWNADKHQLKATVVSEAKARNELGVTW
jgi:alpha-glucosidase (family GH31 glycosyl hydrolase)